MNKKFLTKSRFKVGHECSRKLYYTGKPEYPNSNVDNAFLEALAEGGFQVGALAQILHPGGIEIETLEKDEAIKKTEELLKRDSVIIFEAAFQFKDFFIRADIVEKHGNNLVLTEVKAKSYDASEDQFYNKKLLKKGIRKINSDWEPYLIDAAFQTFVVQQVCPNLKLSTNLMLADKNVKASVDGLNQLFLITHDDRGRTRVQVKNGVTKESVGASVLIKIGIDDEVKLLLEDTYQDGKTFSEYANSLAEIYSKDLKPSVAIGSVCKTCEFNPKAISAESGSKSGFVECWSEATGVPPAQFNKPTVLEIWNFKKSDDVIFDGRFFAEELTEKDFSGKSSSKVGLSQSERQWLQVEKIKSKDNKAFFDHDGLSQEMGKWRFPIHCIDFETTMAAIPFNSGRRPYEQIAFQFSHHIINKDGSIEHKDQYINSKKGFFPNFEFVRTLKAALENDHGTILRYAAHENTVLCQIRKQLETSSEKDRESLIEWIEEVTHGEDGEYEWRGPRSMVDLCEMVKKFYYHPSTNGSNSIKKVLPAILGSSEYLKSKYSKPVYGSNSGVKSLNFSSWRWIQTNPDGTIADPYKLLEPVFKDVENESLDLLVKADSIADGGAAMTAYARMQFTEMSELEREHICKALLRYCELDTFAMVMIYEYWRHEISKSSKKVA